MFLNNLTCNNKFSVTDFLNTLDTVAAIWTFQTLNSRENMNKYSDYKPIPTK